MLTSDTTATAGSGAANKLKALPTAKTANPALSLTGAATGRRGMMASLAHFCDKLNPPTMGGPQA